MSPALPGCLRALLCAASFTLAAAQAQAPASEQLPPPGATLTLHATAQLVVIDVVVTDAKQNPVHDLKKTDLTLLENNQPQVIRSFEEHTAATPPEAAKAPPIPKLPPGTFTNFAPVPPGSSLNILLLDALNTPLKDQTYVRSQMLQFLKTMKPGTRMAIFGLSSRLSILQGFTSDSELLKAALGGKKNLSKASALLSDTVNGDSGADSSLSGSFGDAGSDPDLASTIANLQQFESEQQSFKLQLRAQYTLDAMNQLARYLSGIPGRKNLIWFSGSFPLSILPDGDLANPFGAVASSEDEYRETAGLLARSRVAVYPVDARGLMTSPVYSASASGTKYVRNPTAQGKDEQTFFEQTSSEHATMLQMAADTGGKAFINTNGLKEAVEKAVEYGSNYYTLSYSPSNHNWNGDFRKIAIKLERKGYHLEYRRGYYSDNPSAPKKGDSPGAIESAPPHSSTMLAAMQRGAPSPTQILFKARVIPADAATEATVADGNIADQKIPGPFRRYLIDIAAAPRDMRFIKTPEGFYHCNIEYISLLYDQDGLLVNTLSNTASASISQGAYNDMLKTGMQFHQEISIPVKGNYFLRIGLHDTIGDRVGAIEIPVAALPIAPSETGKPH